MKKLTLALAIAALAYFMWPTLDQNLKSIYVSRHEKKTEPNFQVISAPLIAEAKEKIGSDPKRSWEALTKALAVDPSNTTIRIYRAKMLEGGENPEQAEQEYLAALTDHPEDLALINQYANFLMRQQRYKDAEELLYPYYKHNSEMGAKIFLLGKTVKTIPLTIPEKFPGAYLSYLYNLAPNEYWNQRAFERIPGHEKLLSKEQTTFWLRLLAALKSGDEVLALQILEENSFRNESWNPELESTLAQVLQYRKDRSFTFTGEDSLALRQKKSRNTPGKMNQALTEGGKDLKALLVNPEVFALLLLSSGFGEAAIDFHSQATFPENFPKWTTSLFFEALRLNRGDEAALSFADSQTPNPSLKLVKAKLLVKMGNAPLARNLYMELINQGELADEAQQELSELHEAER